MPHNIIALVVAEPVAAEPAAALGLVPRLTHEHLTVLPTDHYHSAYWAAVRGVAGKLDVPPGLPGIFPADAVLLDLVREITGVTEPRFAIVMTEYFAGMGNQWAVAFRGATRLPGGDIDAVLATLGVVARPPLDEFDTVGFGGYRANPDELDRYGDLCDELGV